LLKLKRTSYRSTRLRPAERLGGAWAGILHDAHVFLYHRPADEFDYALNAVMSTYKTLIWDGAHNEIFDFIQFTMRHSECPYSLTSDIGRILHQCRAAYTIMDHGPTIIPIGSEEEIKALASAFAATELFAWSESAFAPGC
jgi:hypothetical protein